MNKKNIVHIIFSGNIGGAQLLLIGIANEQIKSANVSIIIINSFKYNSEWEKLDKRINLILLNRKIGSKNIFPILKFNYILYRTKANIIHCHEHNNIPLILLKSKRKIVLTVHDTLIESKHFKSYNKLFAISKSVKSDLKNRIGVDSVVICNGISMNKILKKENFKVVDVLNIVVVARLKHNKKGQHIVLNALKILKDKGLNFFHVDFIGTGVSKDYLKDLSKELGITDMVSFLGEKSQDYIYSVLKDYNLFVQPSINEGFGLTVAEALAAKLPVLVSNIEGPMEIIESGKYGNFFAVGNVDDLVEKLTDFYNNYNEENIKEITRRAYEHVKNIYDIKITSQKYLDAY